MPYLQSFYNAEVQKIHCKSLSKFTIKQRSVESLQFHFILTMSHWSSGLPVCFPSQGTRVQIPWVVLMWNLDSPVSAVPLHWWPRCDWLLRPRLRRASSRTVTRSSCWQCDNPTWSHITFLSRFHARCRSPFQLHNRWSRLLGGAPWRACNLTSFSPCLTGPVDYPFASRHKGCGFKSPGGYVCETRNLLLALSCYRRIRPWRYSRRKKTWPVCKGNNFLGHKNDSDIARPLGISLFIISICYHFIFLFQAVVLAEILRFSSSSFCHSYW
jgi:hypothetical protein